MIILPRSRKVLIRIAVVVLSGFVLSVGTGAQESQKPPGNQTQPPPTTTVKGRVVYDDSNRPVRRSPISLVQLPEKGQHSSATDREGRFEIAGVPAGRYFAVVDSPGLITPFAFLKLTGEGPPESWNIQQIQQYCTEILVDGSTTVEVAVRVHRGGAVSGKVTYSDGDPAINAEVGIIRREGKRSQRVLTGVNSSALLSLHTDDRGMYRITALPPGEYVVSAAEINTSPDKSGGYRHDPFSEFLKSDALIVSYYGGTTRLADALSVEVQEGAEIKNLDITLADSTPHTISGSVIAKSDGRVLPGATVTLRNREQADWFLQGSQRFSVDSQGQWSLNGVPDGSYLISVEPPYEAAEPPMTLDDEGDPVATKRSTRRLVRKEIEVSVAGGDVAGVVIELADGASISGVVERPSGVKEEDGLFVMVRYAYEGERLSDYRNSFGADGGEFLLTSLRAGKIYLNADITTRGLRDEDAAKYYIKSITYNGNDLTQKPLTLEAGQSITGVKIVVAENVARATLKLVDQAGKPATAKPVFVVSAEPSKWLFTRGNFSGVSDVNGTFPFSGAPGEYLVVVGGAEESWPPSLELIRTRAATAPKIRLQPGDNKTVTVPLGP